MTNHHTVTITLHDPQETFDTDRQGRILEDDCALKYLAKMECAITFDDKINVATAFRVSLPKSQIQRTNRIAEFLACHARLAIPRYFTSQHTIDIFSLQNLFLLSYLDGKVSDLPEGYDYTREIECHLHDEAYERLLEQTTEYTKARNAFQHAVDKLSGYSELTPPGFTIYSSNVYLLLNFLDDCLHAADLGHLSGWYLEKQRMIKIKFDDLMRRKRASHPKYQSAQDYIRSTLCSYSAPNCWLHSPPSTKRIQTLLR